MKNLEVNVQCVKMLEIDFSDIKKYSTAHQLTSKTYFSIIRGTKDYKTIINTKLKMFLKSANSIQNKDLINHYKSLLNLEANGLETFDLYNDIITHEYFKDNKTIAECMLTGGKLYQETKSILLGDESQRKLIDEFQNFLHDNFSPIMIRFN